MKGEARLSRKQRILTGSRRVKIGSMWGMNTAYINYNIYLYGVSVSNILPYTIIVYNETLLK